MLPALWTFWTNSTMMYWRERTISYNQAALLGFTIILIATANAMGSY